MNSLKKFAMSVGIVGIGMAALLVGYVGGGIEGSASMADRLYAACERADDTRQFQAATCQLHVDASNGRLSLFIEDERVAGFD